MSASLACAPSSKEHKYSRGRRMWHTWLAQSLRGFTPRSFETACMSLLSQESTFSKMNSQSHWTNSSSMRSSTRTTSPMSPERGSARPFLATFSPERP